MVRQKYRNTYRTSEENKKKSASIDGRDTRNRTLTTFEESECFRHCTSPIPRVNNILESTLQTHLVLGGHLCSVSFIFWACLSKVQLYQPLRSSKQYLPGGPSSQKVPCDTSRASTNRKRAITTVSLGDIFLKKEIKFYERMFIDVTTLQQN